MKDELRMYIVFRGDLPEMTRAKGEVQAAHAAASLIYRAFTNSHNPDTARMIFEYMGNFTDIVTEGQFKVAMEVDDLEALNKVVAKANDRGVMHVKIQDVARTIFKEPTITCVAFGPCSKTDGNAITRGARMRA